MKQRSFLQNKQKKHKEDKKRQYFKRRNHYKNNSKIKMLTLPAPIPDKDKKINFILLQLSKMNGAGNVNVLAIQDHSAIKDFPCYNFKVLQFPVTPPPI